MFGSRRHFIGPSLSGLAHTGSEVQPKPPEGERQSSGLCIKATSAKVWEAATATAFSKMLLHHRLPRPSSLTGGRPPSGVPLPNFLQAPCQQRGLKEKGMKKALKNSGGKEPQRAPSPTSSSKQGQLQSVAQGLLQLIIERSPGGSSHHPSGQPAPGFNHSHGNFLSPSQCVAITSGKALALLSPRSPAGRQMITAGFPFCPLLSRRNTTSSCHPDQRGL